MGTNSNSTGDSELELDEHDQMVIGLIRELEALIEDLEKTPEIIPPVTSEYEDEAFNKRRKWGSCIYMSPSMDDFKLAKFEFRQGVSKSIFVDLPNPLLGPLLEKYQANYAGFITASNPMAHLCSIDVNKKRNKELLSLIKELRLNYLVGNGSDPTGVWRSETSFLIFSESKDTLEKLAIICQQAAYLLADRSTVFNLIDTSKEVSDFLVLKPINMSRFSLNCGGL